MDASLLPSALIYSLTIGSFYGLVAIGFTLIYATSRAMNFAHGQIVSLSTYVTIGLASSLIAIFGPSSATILVVVLAIPIGVVAGGIMGVATDRIAFYPLKTRSNSKIGPVLITFGLAILVDNVLFLGNEHGSQPLPISLGGPTWTISGASFNWANLVLIAGAGLIGLGMDRYLRVSRGGKAIRSTALDEETTSLMGVNVKKVLISTFAISGAIAGFAGAAYLLKYGVTDPFMGSRITTKALVAAIVGGLGSTKGALAGGFILGTAEGICNTYFDSEWTDAVAFVVLIAVLVLRPQGVIGERSVAGRF